MKIPVHGLYVTAGATQLLIPNAAAVLGSAGLGDPGFVAMSPDGQGDLSIVPAAATGRLTLHPGRYLIGYNLSVETDTVGGTSGDAAGVIAGEVRVGGTLIAGSKGKDYIGTADQPLVLSGQAIVQITPAQLAAATNYAQIYLSSGDASGNDATVKEGQFWAIRLD